MENVIDLAPELDGSEELVASRIKIKDWYSQRYPNDNIVDKMRDGVTFLDLFDTLDNYGDVYALIFKEGGDSIVRERCFEKLAEIMKCDYNYIHAQWLNSVGE